jgi:hypothetical protein
MRGREEDLLASLLESPAVVEHDGIVLPDLTVMHVPFLYSRPGAITSFAVEPVRTISSDPEGDA